MAPTSARHGLKWYQFDMNWILIRLLESGGLATNIKVFDEGKQPFN
jgi:stearoyl-CoA desaturase (delta-9 desaturase)